MKKLRTIVNQLFFGSMVISILMSCKKDSIDDTSSPTNCRITRIDYAGQNDLRLIYDNASRITLIRDEASGAVLVYSYSPNKMVREMGDPGTASYIREQLTFNADGNVARVDFQYGAYSSFNIYTWDGNRLLSSVNQLGQVTTYTWDSGNLITAQSGSSTSTWQYNNKLAKQGDIAWLNSILGVEIPLKLANSAIGKIYNSNGSTEVYTYNYTYDASGKITSIDSGGERVSYFYTCD